MGLKSRTKERKKCRSVISGKKHKQEMKHKRKENYKKTDETHIECSVCYEDIPDRSDNVIMCGKVKHALCGPCKLKMLEKSQECPMCRSHPIPQPKSQEVAIRVIQMNGKDKISPKKIKIVGSFLDPINCVYEEIGKDKNKISIYRTMNYKYGNTKWYIYHSNKFKEWVLNDRYDQNDDDILGYCLGKLIGQSYWMICGVEDCGEDWELHIMNTSVVKTKE